MLQNSKSHYFTRLTIFRAKAADLQAWSAFVWLNRYEISSWKGEVEIRRLSTNILNIEVGA